MGSKQTQIERLGGIVYGRSPGDTPDGSLHPLSCNMMMFEEGRLRSRTGLERLGRATAIHKAFAYNSKLYVVAAADGSMGEMALSPLNITGIGTAGDPAEWKRPQGVEAGGRFFVTTSEGLKVLDKSGTKLRKAGGHICPGFFAANVTATAGWLAHNSQVAYRVTVGFETADGVQIIGAPSPRRIVQNTSGAPKTVEVRPVVEVSAPDLTTEALKAEQFFIQVWRSRQVAIGIEPDDDLRLVFERRLNSAEASLVSGQLISLGAIEDVTPGDPPDDLRGEYLYTNPNSGEGIDQANTKPPYGELVALWKNRLWIGKTTQPQELYIKMIGLPTDSDRLFISGPNLVLEANSDYTIETGGSLSQNMLGTATNLVVAINELCGDYLTAELVSSPDDPLAEIRLLARDTSKAEFSLYTLQRGDLSAWSDGRVFSPNVPPLLVHPLNPTYSIQRVANVVTATASAGNITTALRAGDRIYVYGGVDPSPVFGLGPMVVTAVGATTFQYAEVGANAGPVAGVGYSIMPEALLTSVGPSTPNRLHYSKLDEYEAFPLNNYFDIGSTADIIALASTRDTFWIFKNDGLYKITGDDETTFVIERLDATLIAINAECVRSFAESIVAWCNKGLVLLSENTFEVLSEDVQPLLEQWLREDGKRTQYDPATNRSHEAFIVADEQLRLVRLHIPGAGCNELGQTDGAGEALVFSLITRKWGRFEWASFNYERPLPFAFGLLNPVDRAIYYFDSYFASVSEGDVFREKMTWQSDRFSDDYEDGASKGAFKHVAIWQYATERAPMRDKRFDEVTFLLEKVLSGATVEVNPTEFNYGFATERDQLSVVSYPPFGLQLPLFAPTSSWAATILGPATRVAIPRAYSRGQRLWIRLDATPVDLDLVIDGYSLLAEVLNQSITR